jgi:hypothetical protein
MSVRPSIQSVQRSLLFGILGGAILGCLLGAALVGLYIRRNPPVYQGGAFPSELTDAYQNHYLAMVVDSYIANQQAELAADRLKTFDQRRKIMVLGERSAAYVAAGRGPEAQLINNLAVALKSMEGWDEATIQSAISELSTTYQADPARSQAISTFSAQLLGQVPVPAETPVEGQPTPPPAVEPVAEEAGTSWWTYLLCCLGIMILALIALLIAGRIRSQRKPVRPKVVWEGEGPAPLKQWTAVYEFGKDNFEDFNMLETDEGDFLGESGMGIREAIPGTSPKQVTAFEVGLFDKTDITTLNKIIMSEHAYHDEATRAKVEANPQDEAILAEPGKEFTVETRAMRVEGKIEDMAYGDPGNTYFSKLAVSLRVFLKEGADVRKGEMDVPDEYR